MNNQDLLSVLVDESAEGRRSEEELVVGDMTMTVDPYTSATGLIERSVAAYASGLADDAADDGNDYGQ